MKLLAAGCRLWFDSLRSLTTWILTIVLSKVVGLQAAIILTLVFTKNALACGVCFFDVDHPMVHGMNAAIFFLLGILSMVFGCFLVFIIHLIKKHRRAIKAGLVSS